jgi:hypothetical protein
MTRAQYERGIKTLLADIDAEHKRTTDEAQRLEEVASALTLKRYHTAAAAYIGLGADTLHRFETIRHAACPLPVHPDGLDRLIAAHGFRPDSIVNIDSGFVSPGDDFAGVARAVDMLREKGLIP